MHRGVSLDIEVLGLQILVRFTSVHVIDYLRDKLTIGIQMSEKTLHSCQPVD